MRRAMIVVLLICGGWLLVSCGGASPDMGQPGASAAASAPAESLERAAECAFPARMRVGQPATVRFSIFSQGNQPNALPSASAAIESLTLPSRDGLTTWVAVSLSANGQPVAQDMSRQLQQLSQRSNIWVWQVTPSDTQPIVLQPIVDVEFRDAEGRVIERQANVWTQTYTVSRVVGSSYLGVASAWLSDSVQELVVGFIGAALLRVGSGGRQLLAQRLSRKSRALDSAEQTEPTAFSAARDEDDRDG